MKTFSTTLLVAAAIAFAVPAAAQEETPPPDTTGAEVQTPEAGAPESEAEATELTHDWEFALSPTDRAAGAGGTVRVTEDEGASAFVVVTTGLPVVDSLDQEGRDVNAYTVWVVPSKDRVPESSLAGVLTIDPESGEGTIEGTTDLATFGVIVTATADGAPERIGGVPVLTGIPVQSQAQPEPEAGEAPAPESPEVDEPAGEADPNEPEGPGEQPDEETPEAPEVPETPESEPEVEPSNR